MSCNYCENKAKYMFQSGESICKTCLTNLPRNIREANLMIVELQKENSNLLSINKCIEYLEANKNKLTKEQSDSLYGMWHKLTFYKYNKRK